MTIKDLREILIHYEDKQYDDWDVTLFDYNNQRTLKVSSGMYSSSKETKSLTIPVEVEPVDGETIDKRIKRLMEEIKKRSEKYRKNNDSIKEGLENIRENLKNFRDEIIKDGEEALKKIGKKDD